MGMVPIGLDVGYGYTKAVSPERIVSFPSLVGVVGGDLFQLDGRSVSRIRFDGREYVCGEAALKHSILSVEVRNRDFVNSDIYRVLTLWALAELKVERASAVFGLPVGHYAQLKPQVLKYGGVCEFEVNGAPVRAVLEVLEVVPQPAGTVFDLLLNRLGEPTSEEFLDKSVGVIDVGYFTTDLIVLEDLEFVTSKSQGCDLGISVLLESIRCELERAFKTSFALREVERVVRKGAVRIEGAEHPVELEGHLRDFAQGVLSFVRNAWGDPRKLDVVILTGGGAELLYGLLKEEIPHLRTVSSPVFSNARGFQKYAVRLLRRRERW